MAACLLASLARSLARTHSTRTSLARTKERSLAHSVRAALRPFLALSAPVRPSDRPTLVCFVDFEASYVRHSLTHSVSQSVSQSVWRHVPPSFFWSELACLQAGRQAWAGRPAGSRQEGSRNVCRWLLGRLILRYFRILACRPVRFDSSLSNVRMAGYDD